MRVHSSLSVFHAFTLSRFHAFTLSRFHAFTLLLCLLSLFLAGCETGGLSSGESAGGQTALTADTKPSSYAQAVEITWEKVDSLEELGITAQTTGGGLVQNTRRGPRNLLFEQGQLTAVRGIDGVATVSDPSVLGVFFPSGSSLTYTWTLPGPTTVRPTLVTTRLPDWSIVNHYIPESQNAVVVSYIFGSSDCRIYVDGELLTSFPRVGYFLIPSFASSNSGLHTLEVSPLGASQPAGGTWHYNQKALRFTEDFPAYDLESEEPVQITNEFEWDNGAPVQGPTWVVRAGSLEKLGSGTTISATWDPKEWMLSRVAESPEGHASGPSDIRAQSDQAGVTYEVRANAVAYPATAGDSILNYAVYSEISSTGQVPGKRAELRIIDAQVLPQPAFEEPGDTVTLTAQAVLIASEANPNDIEWTVDLLDEYGEVVVEDLASGKGPHISTQWDGTVAGQAVEHPTSYRFKIRAEVCEGEPPVFFRGVSGGSSGVLAQDSGGQCLLDGAEVAMIQPLIPVSNRSVALAPAEDLRVSNSEGPFRLMNLSASLQETLIEGLSPGEVSTVYSPAQVDPITGQEIGGALPAVFTLGSSLYLGGDFEFGPLPEDLDEVDFTCRLRLWDRSAGDNAGAETVVERSGTLSRDDLEAPVGSFHNGKLVVPLDVPNELGRWSLRVDWKFEAEDHAFQSVTTPESEVSLGHMVYRVLAAPVMVNDGEPIPYSKGTFDKVTGPGLELFAGSHFPSVLDLATAWASGATDETTAVQRIAQKTIERGENFRIHASSFMNVKEESLFQGRAYRLGNVMLNDGGELGEMNVYAFFLLKALGVDDLELQRFRERAFSKYQSPVGRVEQVDYYLPAGIPLGGGGCDPVRRRSESGEGGDPDAPPPPDSGDPSFGQFEGVNPFDSRGFLYRESQPQLEHSVIQSILSNHYFLVHQGAVYDVSLRLLSSVEQNPHFALNQLSLGAAKWMVPIQNRFLNGTPFSGFFPWLVGQSREGDEDEFFQLGESDYASTFLPATITVLGMSRQDYLQRLLYLGLSATDLDLDSCTDYGAVEAVNSIETIRRLKVWYQDLFG